MSYRHLLYAMSAAILMLWGLTLSTLAYAGVSAYDAVRVVLTDCQLDPYEAPDTDGGPDVWQLPRGTELYAGQSCVTLDEKQVEGELVIWTDNQSGTIDRMSYNFQACLTCEAGDDQYTCTRECYTISDTATTDGYSWDGREYQMLSNNGSDYPVHWVRREIDTEAFDPSAIFQLSLKQDARVITLLMFYRLAGAE